MAQIPAGGCPGGGGSLAMRGWVSLEDVIEWIENTVAINDADSVIVDLGERPS